MSVHNEDYSIEKQYVNVDGDLLEAKVDAFVAYAEHDQDENLCRTKESCTAPGAGGGYPQWLHRQYTYDVSTAGPASVASAQR